VSIPGENTDKMEDQEQKTGFLKYISDKINNLFYSSEREHVSKENRLANSSIDYLEHKRDNISKRNILVHSKIYNLETKAFE